MGRAVEALERELAALRDRRDSALRNIENLMESVAGHQREADNAAAGIADIEALIALAARGG